MIYLSVSEAATILGVANVTVKTWAQRGKLEARKVPAQNGQLKWEVYLPDDTVPAATVKAEAQYATLHHAWVEAQRTGTGYRGPLSPATIKANVDGLKRLWRYLEIQPTLQHMTHETLEAGLGLMPVESFVVREHAYKGFRHFLSWLVAKKHLEKSALVDLKAIKPKRKGKPLRRWLDARQSKHLIQTADRFAYSAPYYRARMKLILTLALETAVRIKELSQLRFEDIHFDQKMFWVINGKGGKNRPVHISDTLEPVLKAWKGNWHEPGKTVLNDLTINGIRIAFNKVREASGLDVDFHGLRRTAATRWYREGVPVRVIQKLLGHEKLEYTEWYLGLRELEAVEHMHLHFSKRKPAQVG